jgi:tetrapyrrole methylase family protein/MazG family protein
MDVKLNRENSPSEISRLLEIVKTLRLPGGCPWDIEQTHKSCKSGLIEESYEAVDAIDKEDYALLREELGDVLLQVVFHSQIAAENSEFNFEDVCKDICDKLIIRHPHVFGEDTVKNTEEVLKNWDKNKKDKKNQTFTDTLKDVPLSLPALMRAQKVGKRAKNANMDFENLEDVLISLENEINEFKTALKGNNGNVNNAENNDNITEELGDIIFSVVNLARHLKIDAEDALTQSTNKFISRFEKVENAVKSDNLDMKQLNINQLDIYWNKIKNQC